MYEQEIQDGLNIKFEYVPETPHISHRKILER